MDRTLRYHRKKKPDMFPLPLHGEKQDPACDLCTSWSRQGWAKPHTQQRATGDTLVWRHKHEG